MIRKASIAISKWLLNTGAISEDDKELYEYAAYSFLFSLLPLCLVIIIGCAVNMVIEGILMVIPFMLIRKFSGGFHLNSSAVCFVSSTALLSLFIIHSQIRYDKCANSSVYGRRGARRNTDFLMQPD